MGKQIIQKLLPVLDKIKWPESEQATEKGRRIYVQGIERIDDYRGDTKVLSATLRLHQTSDSRPYAFAGVAYLLLAAAREQNDTYAQEGLDAAMTWLERAQELEPDLVDINMIEAFIYLYSGQLDNARIILDYLQQYDSSNHYVHRAEVAYWIALNELDEAVAWFDHASQSAQTVPQRLRLRVQLGDLYLDAGDHEKAIAVLKEATHFDKENYLLWHKISVANWQMQDYEEAEISNRRALKLKDFPAGRKMEEAIKQKKKEGGSGVLGRFLGRS